MITLGVTVTESSSQHTTRSSAALVQHVQVELALADVTAEIVDALQPKARKDFLEKVILYATSQQKVMNIRTLIILLMRLSPCVEL